MSTFLAELIGTMILIIFGGGVVAGSLLKSSKAENGWRVVIKREKKENQIRVSKIGLFWRRKSSLID